MDEFMEIEELEIDDDNISNPGDCIGHWDETDKACEICEIQDSCKNMTITLMENPIEDKD
jgi:hypothetical protein